MNVINPNDLTHELVIIPRVYPTESLVLYLFNEAKQTEDEIPNTYEVINGEMFVAIDLDVNEGDKFDLKITELDQVIYRGKIIATSQEPQKYKLNTNAYYF